MNTFLSLAKLITSLKSLKTFTPSGAIKFLSSVTTIFCLFGNGLEPHEAKVFSPQTTILFKVVERK